MSREEMNRPVSLSHLERMTDCFGLIQHANYSLPDFRTGYTTDDNARALVVALKHHRLYGDTRSLELVEQYLSFLMYAQTPEGRFHNFIGYDRRPLDAVGSEDAFGRSLWALGHVLASPPRPGLAGPAERLLHESLPWVEKLNHPRSKAYCIAGLYWWAQAERTDRPRAEKLTRALAEYLLTRYHEHCGPGWDWVLPEFTYANAALPQAFFRAYQLLGDEECLEVGRRTLDFLLRVSEAEGVVSVVGNQEWLQPDTSPGPARFDQQPIEASLLVQADLTGYEVTGEVRYLRHARRSLEWFYGRNVRGLSLYDPETGGCFDALMEHGVNQNRGAESTVSLLLARLVMEEAHRKLAGRLLSEEEEPERKPSSAARAEGPRAL